MNPLEVKGTDAVAKAYANMATAKAYGCLPKTDEPISGFYPKGRFVRRGPILTVLGRHVFLKRTKNISTPNAFLAEHKKCRRKVRRRVSVILADELLAKTRMKRRRVIAAIRK